ncbi:hypothetical protein QBC45DRAFT_332694 [Copromyces sp. CBS 386.78]|nr:hypothetical protein QBC45DRAFT_332694 [Copromyces sp. CBS 386.78]
MARNGSMTPSVAAVKAQSQKPEEVVVDDAKVAVAGTNVAADVESGLLLPEPVSATIAKPADKDNPNFVAGGKTAVKGKKIILHLPSARVRSLMSIIPVDIIIQEIVDARRGKAPTSDQIFPQAVSWFEHLDDVIKGKPGYSHNAPRGKAYERLELQRRFLRALRKVQCDMIISQKVFDTIFPWNKLRSSIRSSTQTPT